MAHDWRGQYVVCVASGPSLTDEQVTAVWEWRQMSPRHKVIVVNRTWERCPWADVLFAMDARWWRKYGKDVHASFVGRLVAGTRHAVEYGADHFPGRYGHSGAGAVAYADACNADKVMLIGYDGSRANGRAHWHEDYPTPMHNASTIEKWPKQIEAVGRAAKAQIINMTPGSCVDCFPFAAWKRLRDGNYSLAGATDDIQ